MGLVEQQKVNQQRLLKSPKDAVLRSSGSVLAHEVSSFDLWSSIGFGPTVANSSPGQGEAT